MKTALILGASGFVGAYLARELHAHGYSVAGADRTESCPVEEVAEYRAIDITDADSVKQVVADLRPDAIVNLAAISSVGQSWALPQATVSVNVLGAVNVFEAVKAADYPAKILLIGSSEEYAPNDQPLSEESAVSALSPYGISKAMQGQFSDLYCEKCGLDVTRTRSFNHTGVGQTDTFVLPSFCKQAAAIANTGKPGAIQVGNLDVVRDFSDVRDIVRAYRLLLEGDFSGEVFNVGSGVGYSLRQLLERIISFADVPISIEVAPERLRPSDNPVSICDFTKLERATGWHPESDVYQALEEMFDYYRQEA